MVTKPSAYTLAITPPGNRPHSIAVFGCTGNAGRAVAYQVIKSSAKNKKNTIKVALSGRNQQKVEQVLIGIQGELKREGLEVSNDAVEIVVADASDEASMLALATSTNILVSCAGPYGRYGEAAVKACVNGGAHYLDITGEVAFIERMIADYGKQAEEAGVTLCPFSGYDCVPSVGKAIEMEGEILGDLALNFRGKGGGFPRGTIQTILDSIEGHSQPKRKEGDPRFYLKEYRNTAKGALSLSNFVLPKYQLGTFTGPNFMSAVNVPVLCRAAPTLGFPSSLTISDKSVVSGPPSLLNGYGLFPTSIYITTLLVGGMALAFPPIRGWIRKKINTGYSYNGDASGKVFLNAQGLSLNKKSKAFARCVFQGDAGIYATGLFAASVANALLESTSIESKHKPLAGFHSPVAALHCCRQGLLVDKLRDLGAEIKVEVLPEGKGTVKEIDAAKLQSKL
eukprot:scaffold10055_cov63-Cyclotella_meneghiniana.AAC.8